MIERFEGEAGRENLLDALRNQKLVVGNAQLAEQIGVGKLIEVKAGTSVITQGTEDTDVFFILVPHLRCRPARDETGRASV